MEEHRYTKAGGPGDNNFESISDLLVNCNVVRLNCNELCFGNGYVCQFLSSTREEYHIAGDFRG